MSNSYLGTLENYLELTTTRHSLVVSNMANIDTPRYRTKDIDFRAALQAAHSNAGGGLTPVVQEVQNLVERPDGNNVSLDREGILLSETQMQFKIGVQLIKTEFHRWLTAINEGK